MTTFGWKRKVGQNISKDLAVKFSAEAETSEVSSDISWIKSFKRKKTSLQENCKLKYEEFKASGIQFAENQKFLEAVAEWDKALNLVSDDYKLLEMKAQALLQINSAFLAVQAAEKSIKHNPRWWVSHQTLGRSQLALGEIAMAKCSFAKAVHLDPTVKELWEEDLKWTLELIRRKHELTIKDTIEPTSDSTDVMLDDDGYVLQLNEQPKS